MSSRSKEPLCVLHLQAMPGSRQDLPGVPASAGLRARRDRVRGFRVGAFWAFGAACRVEGICYLEDVRQGRGPTWSHLGCTYRIPRTPSAQQNRLA